MTLLKFACLAISSQFLLEATVLVVLRNSWRKGPQTIWTMVRAICGFLGTAAARRSCANAPTSIDEAPFLEPTGPADPVTALHACSSSTNNFFFLSFFSFLQRRVDGTVRNTTSSEGEHRERKAKEVRGKAPRLRQRGAHRSCNTAHPETKAWLIFLRLCFAFRNCSIHKHLLTENKAWPHFGFSGCPKIFFGSISGPGRISGISGDPKILCARTCSPVFLEQQPTGGHVCVVCRVCVCVVVMMMVVVVVALFLVAQGRKGKKSFFAP